MDLLAAFDAKQLKETLTITSGAFGLLWYYLCIIDLGVRPTKADVQATGFRQFQSLSITTISVSLATYVGYIIGLPSKNASGAVSTDAGAQAVASAASAAQGSLPRIDNLQLSSAGMYVLSLALAIAFYSWKKDETEPALVNLAKSLLGFVAGVFSVSLSIPAA